MCKERDEITEKITEFCEKFRVEESLLLLPFLFRSLSKACFEELRNNDNSEKHKRAILKARRVLQECDSLTVEIIGDFYC